MGTSSTMEIFVREPNGFSIWDGPPFSHNAPQIKLGPVSCNSAKFSEDGSRIIVMKENSVISVYNSFTLAEIRSLEIPGIQAATLSPLGTYLQTFQKYSTPQENNLILWNVDMGTPIYQQFQKNMTKATWPSIQFSSDEEVACRLATNEIQFFDANNLAKGVIYKLRVPGIAAMELSKIPGSYIAVFISESKGIPASVQVFSSKKEVQSQPVARRSFFRCSTVQLHWNFGATGVLVVSQSDVDKTNQSYYGESKLNYLTTDGAHEGLVPLRKEGPIHDVQWSPAGFEFAVIYGYMPAKATIFDKKCNPLLELGTGPYNTIRWNPKGRFVCLAGFGNLSGDMAFWDFEEKKLLGAAKAECSVTCQWSPNGIYLMTATTAPRLQVDNGIKMFYYNGSLCFKNMFDKLYQAEWRPQDPESFGDINGLVRSIAGVGLNESSRQGKDLKPSQTVTNASLPPKKPAAYQPPQARIAAAVQRELLGGDGIPEEMSKTALKNKKRREKQKEKKALEASAA